MKKTSLVGAVAAIVLVAGCSPGDEGSKLPPSWAATFPPALDNTANCLVARVAADEIRVREPDGLRDMPARADLRSRPYPRGLSERCARG
jgi:hypothetical protein